MQPNLSFYDGDEVVLSDVLEMRDDYFQHIQNILTTSERTVLSFTLVLPGNIKNSSAAKFIFDVGNHEISQILNQQQVPFQCVLKRYKAGFVAIYQIDNIDPFTLKQQCQTLEDSHQLGRLWDIDITISKQITRLSRTDNGHSQRQCFVCNAPAKACARSRNHSIPELITAMEQHLADYITN